MPLVRLTAFVPVQADHAAAESEPPASRAYCRVSEMTGAAMVMEPPPSPLRHSMLVPVRLMLVPAFKSTVPLTSTIAAGVEAAVSNVEAASAHQCDRPSCNHHPPEAFSVL